MALPLTSLEEVFAHDFSGRIGRFQDGRREIIVRWVNTPTRRLHSATECFRGSGYGVTPLPARRDAAGRSMSCFRANRESTVNDSMRSYIRRPYRRAELARCVNLVLARSVRFKSRVVVVVYRCGDNTDPHPCSADGNLNKV